MTVTKQRHSAAFKARVALEAAKQTRTLAEPSCAEPRGRHSTRGRPGSGAGRPAPSTFPPPRGNPAFLRARCFRCELAKQRDLRTQRRELVIHNAALDLCCHFAGVAIPPAHSLAAAR